MDSKFEQIGIIYSLLTTGEEWNIKLLSDRLNVPLFHMRKNILHLINNSLINLDSSEIETEDLLDGKYDFTELIITDPIYNTYEVNFVPLSADELNELSSEYPYILPLKAEKNYQIKRIVNPLSVGTQKKIKLINNIIHNNHSISFTYHSANNKVSELTRTPEKIIYNTWNNIAYFRTFRGSIYRIDRCSNIKEVEVEAHNNSDITQPTPAEVWGISYNEEKPFHVKVNFMIEPTNMLNKLRHDLAYRSATSSFYQIADNNYVYEDDIMGLEDFRHWLREYGAAAKVIEPQELVDQIKASAKRILDNYNNTN